MKKIYYFSLTLAFALAAVPTISSAQTLMDTTAATGISASLDAQPNTATNVRDAMRQKLQQSVQTHEQNIQNNQDVRNKILENGRATTSTADAKAKLLQNAANSERAAIKNVTTNKLKDGENRPRMNASTTVPLRMMVKEIVQERKEVRKQTRVELFKFERDLIVKQLEQSLNNLKQIRERIQTRIVKAEQGGRDMTSAKSLSAIADTKFTKARQAIEALKAFQATTASSLETGTTTPTNTVDLSRPRQFANIANTAIKSARDALNAVVVAIAHSMGLKLGTATTSSTISPSASPSAI